MGKRWRGQVIRRRKSSWYELTAERALWLFAAFTAFVLLTGGGSRYDILSVGPLRFVAALVLAIAILAQTPRSFRRVAVPVLGLLALATWMAIQLVPLPPSWWSALPGRETIYELGRIVGLEDVWRPITISPLRTANSLASLVVPLAALMVLSLLDERAWRRVPWIVIVAGVASALFGIAQLLMPDASGLYLYEITNRGSAVGLFSNRNHNAIFLTIALLFCAFRIQRISRGEMGGGDLLAILSLLIILSGLLVNASRAGLLGLALVGLIFAVRSFLSWKTAPQSRAVRMRTMVGALTGAVSLGLIGLFVFFGRSPALDRLMTQSSSEEQRLQSLPYVLDMVRENALFGTGFGAFEQAFRMIEPDTLLRPRYFNQAHNDWLQFIIEGGIPAAVWGVLALAAIGYRILQLIRVQPGSQAMRDQAWLGALVLLVFALASIVDYPLRTPSLMLVGAIALAMLFKPLAVLGSALPVEEERNSAKERMWGWRRASAD